MSLNNKSIINSMIKFVKIFNTNKILLIGFTLLLVFLTSQTSAFCGSNSGPINACRL